MTSDLPIPLRLKALREAAGLTVRATAAELGVPSSSYAAYEDVNKYKKPYLPLPMTKELTRIFSASGVPRIDVLALGGISEHNVPQSEPEQMADQLDAVLLPEIEVGYSMGGGANVEDFQVVQMIPFSRSWLRGLTSSPASQLFVARGDGDSMMPTLLDGDIVIIDRSERQMRQQDRIWAVSYAGFSMIKRLRALPDGSLQINSDNVSVSPIVATDGEAFIIGRVVGVVRRI